MRLSPSEKCHREKSDKFRDTLVRNFNFTAWFTFSPQKQKLTPPKQKEPYLAFQGTFFGPRKMIISLMVVGEFWYNSRLGDTSNFQSQLHQFKFNLARNPQSLCNPDCVIHNTVHDFGLSLSFSLCIMIWNSWKWFLQKTFSKYVVLKQMSNTK